MTPLVQDPGHLRVQDHGPKSPWTIDPLAEEQTSCSKKMGLCSVSLLRTIGLLGYLLVISIIFPGILYFFVIPSNFLQVIYWISCSFIFLINLLIIIEGISSLGANLRSYSKRDRHLAWNAEECKFQSIMVDEIQYIPQGDIYPHSSSYLSHYSPPVTGKWLTTISADLPRVAVIIPAYLHNEQDIIIPTLEYHGRVHYPGDIEIILVYNTPDFPGFDNLLERLEQLKDRYHTQYQKKLSIVRCLDSHSKAENINYVLDLMKREETPPSSTNGAQELDVLPIPPPKYIVIYDADHYPELTSLQRGIRLLQQKQGDILPGRCVIRNNRYFLPSIIAIEFGLIYIVHHKGGEMFRRSAFFGGSNGIWRYEVLSEIRMDPQMLTEDIDSSFRAIRAGYNIIYSNDVISYELAPRSIFALVKQRLRWAQGWFQVTLRHCFQIVICKKINPWTRFGFLLLLLFREIYHYFAAQILIVFIISFVRRSYQLDSYLLITTGINLIILPLELIIVYLQHRTDVGPFSPSDYSPSSFRYYLQYLLLSPFYDYLKFMITLAAHLMEIFGNRRWRVTSR